jgi:hypothetical protein
MFMYEFFRRLQQGSSICPPIKIDGLYEEYDEPVRVRTFIGTLNLKFFATRKRRAALVTDKEALAYLYQMQTDNLSNSSPFYNEGDFGINRAKELFLKNKNIEEFNRTLLEAYEAASSGDYKKLSSLFGCKDLTSRPDHDDMKMSINGELSWSYFFDDKWRHLANQNLGKPVEKYGIKSLFTSKQPAQNSEAFSIVLKCFESKIQESDAMWGSPKTISKAGPAAADADNYFNRCCASLFLN